MPRGGRRKATPGRAYSNRTDLAERRPIPPPGPSQGYGQRAAQERSLQEVPMAPAPSAAPAAPAGPPAPAGPAPGELGDPLRPTERPGEPITNGIASGPGAGPEALGLGRDGTVDELRALYMAHPNEDLRQLIEDDDEGVLL